MQPKLFIVYRTVSSFLAELQEQSLFLQKCDKPVFSIPLQRGRVRFNYRDDFIIPAAGKFVPLKIVWQTCQNVWIRTWYAGWLIISRDQVIPTPWIEKKKIPERREKLWWKNLHQRQFNVTYLKVLKMIVNHEHREREHYKIWNVSHHNSVWRADSGAFQNLALWRIIVKRGSGTAGSGGT